MPGFSNYFSGSNDINYWVGWLGGADGRAISFASEKCAVGCVFKTEQFIPTMRRLVFQFGEELVIAPEAVFDALEDPAFLNGPFTLKDVADDSFVQWVQQVDQRIMASGRSRADHPFYHTCWKNKLGDVKAIPAPWSLGSFDNLDPDVKASLASITKLDAQVARPQCTLPSPTVRPTPSSGGLGLEECAPGSESAAMHMDEPLGADMSGMQQDHPVEQVPDEVNAETQDKTVAVNVPSSATPPLQPLPPPALNIIEATPMADPKKGKVREQRQRGVSATSDQFGVSGQTYMYGTQLTAGGTLIPKSQLTAMIPWWTPLRTSFVSARTKLAEAAKNCALADRARSTSGEHYLVDRILSCEAWRSEEISPDVGIVMLFKIVAGNRMSPQAIPSLQRAAALRFKSRVDSLTEPDLRYRECLRVLAYFSERSWDSYAQLLSADPGFEIFGKVSDCILDYCTPVESEHFDAWREIVTNQRTHNQVKKAVDTQIVSRLSITVRDLKEVSLPFRAILMFRLALHFFTASLRTLGQWRSGSHLHLMGSRSCGTIYRTISPYLL